MSLEALANAMSNAGADHLRSVEKTLKLLLDTKRIEKLPGGLFQIAREASQMTGVFIALANGSGRIRVSEPCGLRGKEFAIAQNARNGAWNGDIVRAALIGRHFRKAEVTDIIEKHDRLVTAFFKRARKRNLFFAQAGSRPHCKFIVKQRRDAPPRPKGAELALLRVLSPLDDSTWHAEIVDWPGPWDKVATQERIVKICQHVPMEFPNLAMRAAHALPDSPDAADMRGRNDLRHLPFVTIDGADARDFDDAICVRKTGKGYILQVAIADVSHYVLPDERAGSLDAEARARGNSWYFPSSVEPMLPEKLSNGLCSLAPHADRLAILAEMPFTNTGKPLPPSFAPIVMRSRSRITYDDAAAFFSGSKRPDFENEVADMLRAAYELYQLLARSRRARGALQFQMPEAAYDFDTQGNIAEMKNARHTEANNLIEEFMIAANEAVANFLQFKNAPCIYRCHPAPEPEKLARLFETLKILAPQDLLPQAALKNALAPQDIQRIIESAVNKPEEYAVNRLCIRSMGQARYDVQNSGHFGLASPAYCHFTSPIRRYADLLVHRSLKTVLKMAPQTDCLLPSPERLAEITASLNAIERHTAECEREIAKRMACLFLHGKEGQIFHCSISGVTDFGIFVEFRDLPAEGLIHISDLGDDWYEYDARRQCLIGMKNGQIWQLGKAVKAALQSVESDRQEIRLKPLLATGRTARVSRHMPRRNKHGKRNGYS